MISLEKNPPTEPEIDLDTDWVPPYDGDDDNRGDDVGSRWRIDNRLIGFLLCLFGMVGWNFGGGWVIFIGAIMLV